MAPRAHHGAETLPHWEPTAVDARNGEIRPVKISLLRGCPPEKWLKASPELITSGHPHHSLGRGLSVPGISSVIANSLDGADASCAVIDHAGIPNSVSAARHQFHQSYDGYHAD